jgi:aryl-alcohol dehydrogenase-like predicted oxidoreductase
VHAALEAGLTLIDTADAYCLTPEETGHSERLLAQALAMPHAGECLIATKIGQYRAPDGTFPVNGRPEYLRAACERSLRNLRTDVLELCQLHRPDPAVRYCDSVGTLAELQVAGKIRAIGVCNVSAGQLRTARETAPVVSVQNPLSPDEPGFAAMAADCARDGLAFLAYSPFGGRHRAAGIGARHPRFAAVAAQRGVSPQRVVLAWLMTCGPSVIPIPGMRRIEHVSDCAQASELCLPADVLATLTTATAAAPP